MLDRCSVGWSLGPRIIDEIQPGDGATFDLKVSSSRPKWDWTPYITVRFRNELYHLIREEMAARPRQFVYHLRKNPLSRLTTSVLDYKPDDTAT
jgi:hypothetical protein